MIITLSVRVRGLSGSWMELAKNLVAVVGGGVVVRASKNVRKNCVRLQ
jgi:hypothetical protein